MGRSPATSRILRTASHAAVDMLDKQVYSGMDRIQQNPVKVSESTELTFDIKTLIVVISFVITAAGMWFALKGEIEEAKRLPEPVVTRTEYDLKDKLIRETIMNTQEKVEENGAKLDLIEERLYEISVSAKRK